MAERSMAEGPDSLEAGIARLSPAERRVLELLARGHTVKSIAGELDLTPHAVNERLRSARRKYGIGSSRELARLVDLQKDRGQENRTAEPPERPPQDAAPTPPRRESRPPAFGALAMVPALVTAAALAFQIAPSPVSAPPPDPLIEGLVGKPNPDLFALHRQVFAGQRDGGEEARLQSALMSVPAIAHGVRPLRVVCTKTLCEMSGGLLGNNVQPAMDALQGPPLADAMKPLGMSYLAAGFTGDARRGEAVFVTYAQRSE